MQIQEIINLTHVCVTISINHGHEQSALLFNCQLECVLSIGKNCMISLKYLLKLFILLTLSSTKLVKTKHGMYASAEMFGQSE